jgi:hypothetical protein
MSVSQDIRAAVRHRKESRTDLLRRIDDMQRDHKAELAGRDRQHDGLVCGLRKANTQIEQRDRDLNAAIAVAVGRLQEISELKGQVKFQAGKVVRAESIQRSLAQSLVNAHREIERIKPKVTAAYNPARIPPYAPDEPDTWTVIDGAGQALTFGTWMPFPPDPDGEPAQEMQMLADPDRLLSRLLADSGPSVTVGRDTRTAT